MESRQDQGVQGHNLNLQPWPILNGQLEALDLVSCILVKHGLFFNFHLGCGSLGGQNPAPFGICFAMIWPHQNGAGQPLQKTGQFGLCNNKL